MCSQHSQSKHQAGDAAEVVTKVFSSKQGAGAGPDGDGAHHDPEGLGLSVMSTEVLFPQLGEPTPLARLVMSRTRVAQTVWLGIAGITLVGAAAATYATGGTMHAYLHLMYIPIGIAAFRLGAVGGLVPAAIAGLLLG